jgi:hypothetical protein
MLIAILALQSDGARGTLEFVRDRYAKLETFAMTIVHHESSALYPGDFTQALLYRKGGRFMLKVLKPSTFVPKVDEPGVLAPDFFSNGKEVVSRWANKHTTTAKFDPDSPDMAGWEVAGGPILGWLVGTRSVRSYFDPPAPLKVTFRFGSRRTWRGEDVREIVVTFGDPQRGLPFSFFVDPKASRLIGFEWVRSGIVGWAHYRDQRFDPELPADLGEPPDASVGG